MIPLTVVAIVAVGMIGDGGCRTLAMPVVGPVIQTFAPRGDYAGHWGVDFDVPLGTTVHPAGPGLVTFAGRVVDNLTVTIDHGGGVRTSYSYLALVTTTAGALVTTSSVVGDTGLDHGTPALHFSLRAGTRYVDPMTALRCAWVPGAAVRLRSLSAAQLYPRRRARHPGRNLRSSARRPSRCGGSGLPAIRSLRRDLLAGGRPVAEGRTASVFRRRPLGDDRAGHCRSSVFRRR